MTLFKKRTHKLLACFMALALSVMMVPAFSFAAEQLGTDSPENGVSATQQTSEVGGSASGSQAAAAEDDDVDSQPAVVESSANAAGGITTQDDPTVLTVKVLKADGTEESTINLTDTDLAGSIVDTSVSGDPMVGQYYKSDNWNVYRATKYITFEDALAAANVTAGTDDLIGVEASDGPGKVSATLADMAKGKFYPNANGDTYTDDADAYAVPAGIAFEYTKGTGATPAAALTAAEAITPPTVKNLQLMGVYDGSTGGNRFWQGVTTITVQRVEPTVLTVKVLGTDGSVESTVKLTAADIKDSIVDTSVSGDPMLGQYYKSNAWNVYNATKYITFEDALKAANVTAGAGDLIGVEASDGAGRVAATLADMAKGKFYPNATSDTIDDAGSYTVPAGIAFEFTKGTGATPAAALTAAQAETTPTVKNLQLMGVYDGSTGGNRFWQGVTTITVQRVAQPNVTVYRLYNEALNGEHLFTTSVEETRVLVADHGWTFEGCGWYAPEQGTPVYRLYNPGLGSHLYTTGQGEIDELTANWGWVMDFDGAPAFYSGGSNSIYRLYNPQLSGQHLLTTSQDEYNILTGYDWLQEGHVMDCVQLGDPALPLP